MKTTVHRCTQGHSFACAALYADLLAMMSWIQMASRDAIWWQDSFLRAGTWILAWQPRSLSYVLHLASCLKQHTACSSGCTCCEKADLPWFGDRGAAHPLRCQRTWGSCLRTMLSGSHVGHAAAGSRCAALHSPGDVLPTTPGETCACPPSCTMSSRDVRSDVHTGMLSAAQLVQAMICRHRK